MRAPAAFLLAALLLLPLLPAAPAQGETLVEWRYRVTVPDPASGNVRVELTLDGAAGAVTKYTFLTKAHRERVTNVTGGPRTLLSETADGVTFEVDGVESFSYDVAVTRPAFKPGEELGHLGADFALFKAESFALAYTYQFYEGNVFRHRATVELVPPPGWKEAGPWNATAPGVYALPDGQVLPRGYVAMGAFNHDETRLLAGKTVRYVRLGEPGAYEADLHRYLEKATPYYAAVYGPGVERDVLIVNAPSPMFKGGLGGANSFFVHESADLRTVAHEYAHVFQLFATTETPGDSAIWLNEGDADYHSALSLFAAELWSPKQVQDFLDEAAEDAAKPDLAAARLPDAAYGGPLERFAYHKGTHVMRALDDVFRRASGGTLGVSDLLRRLNAEHGSPTSEDGARAVTNADVQEAAEQVLGADLDDFFARFVRGTEWPAAPPFVPEGQVVVSDLRVEPARAVPGETVTARANLTNRGTSAISRDVELVVDGQTVARERVTAEVGQAVPVAFSFLAPPAGDHEVRILYERATLRSLTPANVTLDRASFVPATVRAGEAVNLLVFLANQGEQAGTARVEVRRDGVLLASSTETVVDGLATSVVTLPLQFPAVGPAALTLAVQTPGGEETRDLEVDVQEPDADGDGVADSADAYPANAALWEKSLGNDARDVPGPSPLAALGVLALGALLRRARRA